jgi:predicted NACHT family NTPase
MTTPLVSKLYRLHVAREADAIDEPIYLNSLSQLRQQYDSELVDMLMGAILRLPSTQLWASDPRDVSGDTRVLGSLSPIDWEEQPLQTYLRAVYRNCGEIPWWSYLISSSGSRPLSTGLHDVYTELFSSPELSTPSGVAQQRIVDVLLHTPRVFLAGEPGAGKSTALRYMASLVASTSIGAAWQSLNHMEGPARDTSIPEVPIYAELLPFAQQLADAVQQCSARDLWRYLRSQIALRSSSDQELHAVLELLPTDRAIVLLDGLDEIADSSLRLRVLEAIRTFSAALPHCRMVVACRTASYDDLQRQHAWVREWPVSTIAPWGAQQIREFVIAAYRVAAMSMQWSDERFLQRVNDLHDVIFTHPELERLAQQPMLAALMVLVHASDGKLPRDRSALYNRSVHVLLTQWETRDYEGRSFGHLMEHVGMAHSDVQSLRMLLEDIALAIHEEHAGHHQAQATPIQQLVQHVFERMELTDPHESARRLLVFAEERTGILQISRAADRMGFPHQVFQEYLVGRALAREVDFTQRAMDLRRDHRWREPVLQALEHLVSEGIFAGPYQLFSALLFEEQADLVAWQLDQLLAGEIMLHLGWDRLRRGSEAFADIQAQIERNIDVVVANSLIGDIGRTRAQLLAAEIRAVA